MQTSSLPARVTCYQRSRNVITPLQAVLDSRPFVQVLISLLVSRTVNLIWQVNGCTKDTLKCKTLLQLPSSFCLNSILIKLKGKNSLPCSQNVQVKIALLAKSPAQIPNLINIRLLISKMMQATLRMSLHTCVARIHGLRKFLFLAVNGEKSEGDTFAPTTFLSSQMCFLDVPLR